jgi:predicted NAD-dependent protein-ADP-ribosyltransferase YbiA (DUF1768 family)
MEEYLIYLEQFYTYKNGFLKNNTCEKCGNNIIFKETKLKNDVYELELSCGDEKKKNCGIQFIIRLPKTKNIDEEISKLNKKINTGFNYDILSKYINLKKTKPNNELFIEKIEELNNLFNKSNLIKEKTSKIKEILKEQETTIIEQNTLIEEVKEDMNQFEKKELIKKYLENNKKLQENYKEINEIKYTIDNIVIEEPAKILSTKEIKEKSKETDKEESMKFNLELDDGTVIKVDSLSPDSPRKLSEDVGENMLEEYTDVEKLFNKRKDKFNDDEEDECKKSIVWKELLKIKNSQKYYKKLKEITTNPKYYIFNQTYFHAGDEVQFERYGFIKSRYLKYADDINDKSIFSGYNIDTTYKTFEYIFNKLKKGIYVSFKNNQLDTFIPFSNIEYINDWSRILESSNPELVKKIIDKEKYGEKINISDPSKWYANNCIFKTDGMKFKFRNYIGEGDKTVIPFKYFLKGFELYLKDTNQTVDDFEFFFNPRDFPILKENYMEPYEQIFPDKTIEEKYHHEIYTPILSQSGNKNYHDLLSPTEDDMMRITKNIYPDDCKNNYSKKINFELDFSKKKPICVFRGSATGCGITSDTNMRLKAAKISHELNEKGINILDAKLTGWNKKPKMYNGELNEIDETNFEFSVGKFNFMKLKEQSKHKYILNIDGHVKAFRLGNEFRMGSVILLVDSQYTLWFQQYLEEDKHYISINKDLTNLEEKINWCIEHDKECEQIAKNGLQFYNDYLTPEKTYSYFFDLTTRLSKIRKEPIYNRSNNYINIVVAYRNSDDNSRFKQLEIFKSQIDLIFKNRINYHIYVIEQESDRDDYDSLPDEFKQKDTQMAKFNLGRLKNIGFFEADKQSIKLNLDYKKTYYILSDIDLLPSYNLIDDYLKYPDNPIHLANLGTRYNEKGTDSNFLGGVISFKDEDFVECNGFPNNFWGWGGEDNVLFDRLKTNNINIDKSEYPVIDLENISIAEKSELMWKKDLKMDKTLKKEEREKDKKDNNWQKNGLLQIENMYDIIEKIEENENITHFKVFLKIDSKLKKKDKKGNDEKQKDKKNYIKFKFGSKEGHDLSNFSKNQVILNKIIYITGEHAFHSQKYRLSSELTTGDRKQKLLEYSKTFEGTDSEYKTGLDAKKAGGKKGFELTSDEIKKWNEKSMEIQYNICKYKIKNNKNIQKLLSNKNTLLIHQDNRANESTIWGARIKDGKQIGQNKLGEVWMKVRDDYLKEPKKEEPKKEEPKKEPNKEPNKEPKKEELVEVQGFKVSMNISWNNKKGDEFIGTIKEIKEKFAIIETKDGDKKIPYSKLSIKKEEPKKKEPKKGKPKKEEPKKEEPKKEEPKKEEPKKDSKEKTLKEGVNVSWKDSKGNHKGVITKMNPKTANITEDNGDSKRVPIGKLTIV